MGLGPRRHQFEQGQSHAAGHDPGRERSRAQPRHGFLEQKLRLQHDAFAGRYQVDEVRMVAAFRSQAGAKFASPATLTHQVHGVTGVLIG